MALKKHEFTPESGSVDTYGGERGTQRETAIFANNYCTSMFSLY